jgi:hypothetical protein
MFPHARQCAWQRFRPDVNGSITRERRQGAKEERMPHWTVPKAMMIMLFGAVLLSIAPAIAGAIGTTTTVKPLSRTAVIEVPRDGEGREVRETQDMFILLFISGVILGVGLGLLGYRVLKGWRGRQERQRDMDQLTEQFQALFREIDSGKNPYP